MANIDLSILTMLTKDSKIIIYIGTCLGQRDIGTNIVPCTDFWVHSISFDKWLVTMVGTEAKINIPLILLPCLW